MCNIKLKRIACLSTVFMFCISFMLLGVCYAFQLLTKDAALEKVFGSGCEIKTETKELSGAKLSTIKERLGGNLVHYEKGSKSAEVEANTKEDFYFAFKEGKKVGVALIDSEPGKWGPVEFIIALDLQGAVTAVEVMNYQEKRGRPIARRSYMSQYFGRRVRMRLR